MTDVINVVAVDIETASTIIRGVDNNIQVLHDGLYTCHYTMDEYVSIFKRRARRFMDIV
jgi:hypothetical protein